MTYKKTTINKVLQEKSIEIPNKTFLTYKSAGKVLHETFGEFYQSAQKWALFFHQQKLKHGDRIMMISTKNPAQVRAFYGAWIAGCTIVPVCESLHVSELKFIENDCKPKLILLEDKLEPKLSSIFRAKKTTFDQIIAELPDVKEASLPEAKLSDTAAIIYTSGSTGNPKGVKTTHLNLAVNAQSAINNLQANNETIMSILPLWHSFALTVEIVLTVFSESAIIFARDRRDFMKNMSTYKPSIILVVPRILDVIKTGIEKNIENKGRLTNTIFNCSVKKKNFFSRIANSLCDRFVFDKIKAQFGEELKYFVSGGAPLSNDTHNFFNEIGLTIINGYGLSESSPVISVGTPHLNGIRIGSVGKILDWLKPENGGDYCFLTDSGEMSKTAKGELMVKGDCVMDGYWRHADQSAKALQDGWLNTGDIGYVDDAGFLFIEGRKGNMIVLLGGEKFHPEHIETKIKKTPFITEAMVIGEKMKNSYLLLNIDPEYKTNDIEKDIIREVKALNETLPAYQAPKGFAILPAFTTDDETLTASHKIRRFKILEVHKEEIKKFLKKAGEL